MAASTSAGSATPSPMMPMMRRLNREVLITPRA
jgi:hypothetical protein